MNKIDVVMDFHRKYNETYLFANPHGEFDLFYTIVRQNGEIQLTSEELGDFSTFFGGSVEFQMRYPKLGFFSHNGIPLSIYKTALRQWKRGISNSNFGITTYGTTNPGFSTSVLKSAFEENKCTEAKFKLAARGKDVILSREFMVNNGNLFFKLRKIGPYTRVNELRNRIFE